MMNIPKSYIWFSKLKLVKFIPWHIDPDMSVDRNSFVNKQFKKECNGREVITFASRQDQDTFAGFEVVNDELLEKVLVFHPSFGTNAEGWNIVQSEYDNFFEFLKSEVLPEMEEWIETDDVEDYI